MAETNLAQRLKQRDKALKDAIERIERKNYSLQMNEKKIRELEKNIDDVQINVDSLIRQSIVLTRIIEKYLNKGSL